MADEQSLTRLTAVNVYEVQLEPEFKEEEPIKQLHLNSNIDKVGTNDEYHQRDLSLQMENIKEMKSKTSMSCQHCSKEFKTEFWLNKHIQNYHAKINFQCDLCGKIFKRNSALKAHHREIHSLLLRFVCVHCDYATNNKTNLRTHIRVRHSDINDSKIKCDSCNEKFFRKADLERHNIKEHNASRFVCDVCDKSYTSKQYLLIHSKTHKPGFSLEHLCVVCGKLFVNSGRLKAHVHRKHSDVQYSCELCMKVLSSRVSLRDHMTHHSGKKCHDCSVCGKVFATRKYLTIHSRTHTGEKPYSCSECDQSFTQKTSLSVHKRRYHMEIKPYNCNVCRRGFVTSTLLKKHLKSHKSVISSTRNCSTTFIQ